MNFKQKEAEETLNKIEEDGKTWTMDEFGWDSQTCRVSPPLSRDAVDGTTGRTSGVGGCSANANLERAIPFLKHSSSSEETTPTNATSLPHKSYSRPGYCQADGCGKKLENLTYYHARNKICDVHIKADVFTRDGCSLRFCQRCGNAHSPTEFDGKKHSCRAQLEKHNARRRKRQNEAAAAAAGSSKSKHKKSQALPSSSAVAALVGVKQSREKGEEVEEAQPVQRSSRKRVPLVRPDFVEDDDEEEEHQQQLLQHTNKNRAASPVLTVLPFSTEDHNQDQESDALLDDLSSWLTAHFVDIPNFDGNNNDDDDVLNLLPLTSAEDGDSFDFAISLMHPDLQMQPSSSTIDPLISPSSLSSMLNTAVAAAAAGVPFPVGPTLTESAKLSTVSIKLFGCTPDELPQDLRSQLMSWFDGQVASLEGYMRPGCVHLTVQATTLTGAKRREPESGGQEVLQGSVGNSVERLVQNILSSGDDLWRSKTLLVQTGTEIALLHGGKLQKSWEINGSSSDDEFIWPTVIGTQPLVLLSSSSSSSGATKLVIQGVNLLQDDCEIVCRLQGQYVAVERAGCTDCKCVVAVKDCCRRPSVSDEFVAKAEGWQSRCCGCCIGKLATLSINDDSDDDDDKEEKPSSSSCCGGGSKNKSRSNTAQVDQVAPQLVSLHLSGALRPGLLHVDVLKRAYMAAIGGRVLVVDSAVVQDELMALAARSPEIAASWVNALSIVFEYIGNPSKVSYSSVVERITARLLHHAVGAGLIEVAKRLHSLLNDKIMEVASLLPLPRSIRKVDAAGGGDLDGLALLSHIDQACRAATLMRACKLGCTDKLSLLHRAVMSQNPAAVDLVLMWGHEANYHWRSDEVGPRGLTPLHFAALVGDYFASSRMILAMVTACAPGVDAWRGAKTADEHDGLTPADFAARLKRTNLLDAFGGSSSSSHQKIDIANLVIPSKGKHPVEQEEEEKVGPATPRRCKCVGNCPCAMAAEPCASCCSAASSADEVYCGGEDGTCACCSSAAVVVEKKSCCAPPPPPQKRSCCH